MQLFLKFISLLSSLSMTYLGVIEAYKVEKSGADKSPFDWQIMKFFLKLTQSLMFSFSSSPCLPPSLFPAYIFPMFVCQFFLLRF